MSYSEWKQWEDLPPEEEERLIDEIVKRLVKRKLGTLALMLLESGGPLTNLFAELWMGLYGPYFDFIGVDRYMALLRKKRNVERLIYVEPIYLQAEAAAYPELRLVAVMYGDNLSYAETFDKALQGLLTEAGKKPPPALALGLKGQRIPFKELVSQANDAFKNYLRLQGEGRFVEAAKELTRLQEALQQLSKQIE